MKSRILITLTLALALAGAAFGQGNVLLQNTADASNVAGAGKQATIQFFNQVGSANIAIEFIFSGAPGTTSVPVRGCMRSGTCTTLATVSSGTNQTVFVNSLYDYISLTPVFTGGTNPFLTANYTAISQSAGNSGVGTNGGLVDQVGNVSMAASWGCASIATGTNVGCVAMGVVPYYLGGATNLYDRGYYCNQSVPISTAAASTVQLVAITGSEVVKVCGFILNSAGTTTVKFQYGTGASCGTGTTDLTGAMALVANSTIVAGTGGQMAEMMRTPAGNAFCMVNSAAVQVSGILWYTQI